MLARPGECGTSNDCKLAVACGGSATVFGYAQELHKAQKGE
jgi:hypothetical protein